MTEKQYWLKKVGDTEWGYIDQDGVSYESPASWLWSGILGGCGCESSDELAEKSVYVLKYLGTPHEKRDLSLYDDFAGEVIAHWMDHEGLSEHGSGICCGWLTSKGEQVLESINRLSTPPKQTK